LGQACRLTILYLFHLFGKGPARDLNWDRLEAVSILQLVLILALQTVFPAELEFSGESHAQPSLKGPKQ
jgi:hypothetical protein